MSVKIPISIGFEFETQYFSPILVNDRQIQDIYNGIKDDIVFFKLHSKENDDLYLYGDAFTDSEFSKLCKDFQVSDKQIRIKELYSRGPDHVLKLKNFYSKLSNTEFVNTFPVDKEIVLNKLWTHILKYMKKTIKNIEDFINNPIQKYKITSPHNFPFSFLYYSTFSDVVDNGLNELKNKIITIYESSYRKYSDNISRLQTYYPDISNNLDQYQRLIEDTRVSSNYSNPNKYRIGFLSRLSLTQVSKEARFVCQCTLGFPIIYSIQIMNQLYQMVKKIGEEMELLVDFEKSLEILPFFESRLNGSRKELLLNYIFLFYYSMLTKDKRKENSLFTIRANFQTLMYILNRHEKELLLKLIPNDKIKSLFQDIHLARPYLKKTQAGQRQNNLSVTMIHDNDLKKFQYTDINDQKTADIMTKVYVEFRMLNYVLEHKKKKRNLTLSDMNTII